MVGFAWVRRNPEGAVLIVHFLKSVCIPASPREPARPPPASALSVSGGGQPVSPPKNSSHAVHAALHLDLLARRAGADGGSDRGDPVSDLRKRLGNSEAEEVSRMLDVGRVARRGTHVQRVAPPGTAAYDTPATVNAGRPGPAIGRCRVTLVPAILDPLLDIAQNIIQSESVRRKRADG